MPRARKKPKATEPTPLSAVLETLPVAELIDADAAVESFKKQREREQAVSDPAQSDALAGQLEARRRKSGIEPERAMPVPEDFARDTGFASNSEPSEILGKHTAAERFRHPKMQPAPAGYFGFASDRDAGVRVCKAHDHKSVCLQFSDDHTPSRPEKDFLERVGAVPDGTEYIYQPGSKIWRRETPPSWTPGENSLDAVRTMLELAKARNEGLVR